MTENLKKIVAQNISKSVAVLPDVDYDTDARDEVKKFLQEKYGKNHE